MATNISGTFDAGIARFNSEEFFNNEVMSGDTPPLVSNGPETVGENTDLAAFAVVGRTGNAPGGALVLANYLGAIGGDGSDVAQGTLTFATPPDADDTVVIGSRTYTWKATPAAANQIKTGATNTLAADALVAAINADPAGVTAGLIVAAQTEDPNVYAVKVDADTVQVYARVSGEAGNAIATTQTGDEATWGAATLAGGEGVGIVPVGILPTKLLTGAGVTTTTDILRQGCFNPDALVWDASFDTDAKKKVAFEGSPSPTNIVLRKNNFGPVYP